MGEYSQFFRGRFPVGVKSYEFTDSTRKLNLPVECWYPAQDTYMGKDLNRDFQDRYVLMPIFPKMRQSAVRDAEPAEGFYPLVIFSHGLAGHRRQTTHFCTHLASHGYIVASPDHIGTTMPDMFQLASELQKGGNAGKVLSTLINSAKNRPRDVIFTIDQLLTGEMGSRIDPNHIGITGHSFGGWTTLAVTSCELRIKVALPLAPAGGKSQLNPMANMLSEGLDLNWGREVPVLFLVAELDTILPMDGLEELFARVPEPKNMAILLNADHFHFCDFVEQTHDLFRQMGGLSAFLDPAGKAGPDLMKKAKPSSELCPGKDAYRFIQGLGLAHMDAHLKGNPDAMEFLKGDLQSILAGMGIKARIVKG